MNPEQRILILERALRRIAELPFVTEERAGTWKDISNRQTELARVALEDNQVVDIDHLAQLTEQDLKSMSPQQIETARVKGQLADLLAN